MANAGSRTRDPTLKCLWAAACLCAWTASVGVGVGLCRVGSVHNLP